jgi:precorrin-6A/cobalt-precorrin-6A reductase
VQRDGAPFTVLILGGTAEGYELARAIADMPDVRVVSSLAGRTAAPRLPAGEVRIGGFGGADGLAAYLRAHDIAAVIDATHPFAATMGHNAAVGCQQAGVPLLRLERPAWRALPGDRWVEVDDWDSAVRVVDQDAQRVLLAVGRQEIAPFAAVGDTWFLIRSVDAPDPMPPFRQVEVLLARGPFDVNGERELLTSRRIDTVVCKNSGGSGTDAKLVAARELGIRVVMKRRPPRPAVAAVPSALDAAAWVQTVRIR